LFKTAIEKDEPDDDRLEDEKTPEDDKEEIDIEDDA
jgi:hypothetical protein